MWLFKSIAHHNNMLTLVVFSVMAEDLPAIAGDRGGGKDVAGGDCGLEGREDSRRCASRNGYRDGGLSLIHI